MSESIKMTHRNSKEMNEKTIARTLWKSKEEKELVESMQRKLKVDIRDPKAFPVMEDGFSFGKIRQQLVEADSASTFPQVLRAGVQSIVNSMYQTVPVTYSEWVQVVQSSKQTELYAPLQGIKFPKEVGAQEQYPEVRAAGLDIALENKKYGTMYACSMELIQDDQTGQFQKQVGILGEYLQQVNEVLCYGKLASVANMQYDDLLVPVSETQPSTEATYPWSTSLTGGGATRPSSYGALTQANLQAGYTALLNQRNILGLKMAVMPNRILISPHYQWDISILLNSAYYPSGAASAGSTGGAFAINPIKGIADVTISRFMFDQNGSVSNDSKAWYIVDASKPWFVLQMREAAVVEQEATNAGDSFNRDIIRFKARSRCNADFIDPRFAWQGSNGSV